MQIALSYYHIPMHGILLSHLGWYPLLLPGAPSCYLELLVKLQKHICWFLLVLMLVLDFVPLLSPWLIIKM